VARPDISVLIPARNEQAKLATTIRAIARARTTDARVEFVVVDDASTDDSIAKLVAAVPALLAEPGIDIRLGALEQHSGNYCARNRAAEIATADVLFITDAHVEFSRGWDALVLGQIGPQRILAGTVTDRASSFRGFGCSLLVPLMGTAWNRTSAGELAPVPISVCAATVIARDLFMRLGGYDGSMLFYGGGEPEFSVRAWLQGAEIRSLPELEVEHRFKSPDDFTRYLASVSLYWVHNCIRFGLLYLSEMGCLQLLRYHARAFPELFPEALALIGDSDLWERRAYLERRRRHSFDWFVDRFELKNQIGGEIA
jgi:glycosyltransferase involved in cell wall biosynthesis